MIQILAAFMMVLSAAPSTERMCVSPYAYSSVMAQYTPDPSDTQVRILIHDYSWHPKGSLLLELREFDTPVIMVRWSRIDKSSIIDNPHTGTESLATEHTVATYVVPVTSEEHGRLMDAYRELVETPEPDCRGWCSHCISIRIDSAGFGQARPREKMHIQDAKDEDRKFVRAVLRLAKQNMPARKSKFLDEFEDMLDLSQ